MNSLSALKKLNLPEFCIQRLGYKPIIGHDSRLWRTLKSPSGVKIIAKSHPESSGDYLFLGLNSDIKGNLISLLTLVHGMSLSQIKKDFLLDKNVLLNHKSFRESTPELKLDNTDYVSIKFDLFKRNCIGLCSNYLNKRGIKNETLDHFGIRATENEAMFPLYYVNDKGRFRVSTAITYYFDRFDRRKRLFMKGCKKGGAYSLITSEKKNLEQYDTLNLFESPIDALSAIQLDKVQKNAINISFCGGFGLTFMKQLKILINKLEIINLNICLDNDPAGHSFAEKIDNFLQLTNTNFLWPESKDWNDDLINLTNF